MVSQSLGPVHLRAPDGAKIFDPDLCPTKRGKDNKIDTTSFGRYRSLADKAKTAKIT